jgi:hypothetical protein
MIPRFRVFVLVVFFASVAIADDFKTTNGKEYKNANVSRVEPDGILITFSGGIVKLPFTELAGDVQKKYGYDSQTAATYTAEENQKLAALAQQRQAEAQKRAEEREKYWSEQAQIKSQQEADIQRQQRIAEQQRQAEIQRIAKSTPSVSKEGIPEHTYEIVQDYTILMAGTTDLRRRLRRGERYHGRILVDHAEIDINGISYSVPSGILSAPKD